MHFTLPEFALSPRPRDTCLVCSSAWAHQELVLGLACLRHLELPSSLVLTRLRVNPSDAIIKS